VLWKAIHTYLSHAYDGATAPSDNLPAETPSAVRARLDTLRSTPDEAFYDSPVFEVTAAPAATKDAKEPPTKYALRLGNRSYPHMKLVIERSPDGQSYLLRADTHDSHVQPKAGSREAAAFAKLAQINREVADRIEGAWEVQKLPTFKQFLRNDLLRRKASSPAIAAEPGSVDTPGA
jgi:hypothetical protein